MKSFATTLAACMLAAAAAQADQPRRLDGQGSVTTERCSDRSGDCYRSPRDLRRTDCHRDVRTHRIGGDIVRHRHVGDDCAVRAVRRAGSAGRPD